MLDEVVAPGSPPAIVLQHLDDDLLRVSNQRGLAPRELKAVAKAVLEALNVLHKAGFVHTGGPFFSLKSTPQSAD